MALARKLVHELMVVSPVVLILGIAVSARTRVEPFEPVGYDPVLQQRMKAYVVPVRRLLKVRRSKRSADYASRIRAEARSWLALQRDGILLPLPSSEPGDTISCGIKAQIFRALDALAGDLYANGREAAEKGAALEAAQDMMLAAEVLDVLKFSDTYGVGLMAGRQRQFLISLREVVPQVPAGERPALAARLEGITKRDRQLGELIARTRRSFVAYSRSQGVDRQAIEDVQQSVFVSGMILSSAEDAAITRAIDGLALANRDSEIPYFSEIRFAWLSHTAMTEIASEIERELRGR